VLFLSVQICDAVTDQEILVSMPLSYLMVTDGMIFVYDVNDKHSITEALRRLEESHSRASDTCCRMLLATHEQQARKSFDDSEDEPSWKVVQQQLRVAISKGAKAYPPVDFMDLPATSAGSRGRCGARGGGGDGVTRSTVSVGGIRGSGGEGFTGASEETYEKVVEEIFGSIAHVALKAKDQFFVMGPEDRNDDSDSCGRGIGKLAKRDFGRSMKSCWIC
jgi:hypothetical protein